MVNNGSWWMRASVLLASVLFFLPAGVSPSSATVASSGVPASAPQTAPVVVSVSAPVGDAESGGTGSSGNPGSVSGGAGNGGSGANSGGSGGGYHDSWYAGWAQWPEGSTVTRNPRTTAPNFKGYVAEHGTPHYLDQTSPYYDVGTMTLEDAMLKAWRKEEFNWRRQNGNLAEVDLPAIARKCRQGTEYPEANRWANPMGFQYSIRVQWYNAGGGRAWRPTLREFHFGYKDSYTSSHRAWMATECQSEPNINVGNRVCPQYLESPMGWFTKERYYLPYGREAALPNRSGGWITPPDEIRGAAEGDYRVTTRWDLSTIRGGRAIADAYYALIADSRIEELRLARRYGMVWEMYWSEEGPWENKPVDRWEEATWEALRAYCGAGKALKGRFLFEDAVTGELSDLLGHRFATSQAWTKRCPTIAIDRAVFRVPGEDRVFEKQRIWEGCDVTTTLNPDPTAAAAGVINISVDQYTLTCEGLNADGFPIIRQTGLNPYADKSWRDWRTKTVSDEMFKTFTLGVEDFAVQAAGCVPTEPAVQCVAGDVTRYMQPYLKREDGSTAPSSITSPTERLYVDINVERPDDVEVRLPGWYNSVLTPAERERMRPDLYSRSVSVLDNGAIPEVGDGKPRNEPFLVDDATHGGLNPLSEGGAGDTTNKHTMVGDSVKYSDSWVPYLELSKETRKLGFHFVKSTSASRDATGGVPAGATATLPPSRTTLRAPRTPLNPFKFGEVEVARGDDVTKFLNATGLHVGSSAGLLPATEGGWVGVSTREPVSVARWNDAMRSRAVRPKLVIVYEGTTPVLKWSAGTVDVRAVVDVPWGSFRTQWFNRGVRSFQYLVWDPYAMAPRPVGGNTPLPARIQVSNTWKVDMPVFQWRVGPGSEPVPFVSGWTTTFMPGCGVGSTDMVAVKGRGGGSAVR